ncbi:SCO family protein [Fervidibacter sacchari]|uniref:Protein SCO1/2 n=1 Tax=Candidatus Fervidibacter sacchari TaxID=1448929 RepID=A0ABT2EK99_9BACT|nr:SCO family protein [Candidatus Fervidibacter sacchari]MCS3918377.1 protein SCO1/2 [Candidatus Fervidibacter sacchari]WKU16165.1 SCO family protein [Candidatus Fervidibacter sacchari]
MRYWHHFVSLIAVMTIVIAITSAFVHFRSGKGRKLPVYWVVPNFQLIAHDKKPFGLKDLKGKIWVAEFFFASCAGICPIMNQNMTEVQKAFADNPDVIIVSITVDPKNDTPEVLKEYRQNFGAIDGKWFFLTGDKKAIYQLARHGFKVAAEEVPPQEEGGATDFIHSDRFILVDRHGRIRGFYNGTDKEQVKKLINDIRELLRE